MKKSISIIFLWLSIMFVACTQVYACKQTITLRNDKSLTEQLTKENVIYIINTVFDLHSDTIVVPKNSTLRFKSGELYNGVIVGQDTKIITAKKKIFGSHLKIVGSWDVDNAYSEWFGPRADGSDDTEPIRTFFNFPASKKTLKKGVYGVYELHCEGLQNTDVYAYGVTLKYLRTELDDVPGDHYVLSNYEEEITFSTSMKGYVHIYGLTIDGNSNNFIFNPKPTKQTGVVNHHTLVFAMLDELLLKDCTFKNSFMTAVMLDVCKHSEIVNCSIINSGESVSYTPVDYWYTWEGVAVTDRVFTFQGWRKEDCDECIVKDSYFENIGGSFASANCKTFRCLNNTVKDNRGYAFELSGSYKNRIVEIKGNKIYGLGSSIINMTSFYIPDDSRNSITIADNEFYDIVYDNQRTRPAPTAFLMIYRNKGEKGSGKLKVTIENNLIELNKKATQGLIKCDDFVFSSNKCVGFSSEANEALFFCANDEYQGEYRILNNEMDFNSGGVAIIRSPKLLDVSGNKIKTSKSPAIVYIQGTNINESEYRIDNNEVEGIPNLAFVSISPKLLYMKGNKSHSVKSGIIRTTSDVNVKSVFADNSFSDLSTNSRNIVIVDE